jgi:hypothetical protein
MSETTQFIKGSVLAGWFSGTSTEDCYNISIYGKDGSRIMVSMSAKDMLKLASDITSVVIQKEYSD